MPDYEPVPRPGEEPAADPADPADRARLRERLRERYDVDMVGFAPGEHDVRIERDGWVYYVRAVRWGRPLGRPPLDGATYNPLALAVIALGRLAWTGVAALGRGRSWRVGVVRGPDPASWHTGEPVVLHREVLEPGEAPDRRIAGLAADVRAGRFPPPTPSG